MQEYTRDFKRTSTRKHSRFSRRLRKKLIRILTALNEIDFSFLRPVSVITVIALLITVSCLLPTSKTDNLASPEAAYGEELAAAVRAAVGTHSTDATQPVDVVALFLPAEDTVLPEDFASFGKISTGNPLYSFYLTGKELSFLAESAVSFPKANPDSSLFLSGLSYSYHPLRLPMNRVTEISFADGTEIAKEDTLYRVVATEEIFPLLQYLSYRSQNVMHVSPKDENGVLLSAYEEALLTTEQTPLSVEGALRYAASERSFKPAGRSAESLTVSTVTRLGGFNLITLLKNPNRITIYISLLVVLLVALLGYCIPRIRRVRLWIRIYAIHSRKRGHAFYRRKRNSYRKAG